MRIKRLQPVVDASGLDKVGGPEVVKKHMMPSSFAGGLCCMTEDFHDAVAVSQVHGSPDIFTTFACDPEWPERIETLEHGQKAVDGADITIQIHQMKLLDYLHTIRTGQVFGTVLAGTMPSTFSSSNSFFLTHMSYFSCFTFTLLLSSCPHRGVPENGGAPCTYPCLAGEER